MGYIREFWIEAMPLGTTGHEGQKKGERSRREGFPRSQDWGCVWAPAFRGIHCDSYSARTHDRSLHNRWGQQILSLPLG